MQSFAKLRHTIEAAGGIHFNLRCDKQFSPFHHTHYDYVNCQCSRQFHPNSTPHTLLRQTFIHEHEAEAEREKRNRNKQRSWKQLGKHFIRLILFIVLVLRGRIIS